MKVPQVLDADDARPVRAANDLVSPNGLFHLGAIRRRRIVEFRSHDFDFDFETLRTRFEPAHGALWVTMTHERRACFTPEIMRDMRFLQRSIEEELADATPEDTPLRYVVWASEASKAWSLGGDLDTFVRLIRERDVAGLRAYAHLAVEIIHANFHAMNAPLITVSLVAGDALGGGLEALLTEDVIVAEESARFGLPEILFNLFPGMGAQSLLRRKAGEATARKLIGEGRSYDARDLQRMGLVHHVCETGAGERFVRERILKSGSDFRARLAIERARRRADPVERAELFDIVDLWVDLAMGLEEHDLARMALLACVQAKKRARHVA